MAVVVDLSSHAEETLQERAAAAGLSKEEYAQRLLERDLKLERASDEASLRGAAEDLLGRIATLPEDVFEGLPTDGASQHDHYIYGTPKRDDL